MLFLRHIIKNSFLGMCNVLCSKNKLIGKEKPLQARVERWILLKRNRASCFGSSRASITVETSLVFPVFICVLCCFMALAQMVLIETEVHYAASQTAKVCAQKAVVQQPQNARGVFFSIYEGGSLCENLIDGGKRGISIHSTLLEGEQLQIKAAYTLKVPVPFFSGLRFRKKTTVKRRIFSGYVKHWGEYEEAGDNQIVYVAENGVVYHKDSSCSHICLKITGSAAIQGVLHSSKYAACEKCIKKGKNPSALFVTAYGDCYHSTLGCSGLKRTIKAVKLKDVGNLRSCSRCASRR